MTLRERLMAAADEAAVTVLLKVGGDRGTFHDLALAAARLALEDAAAVCDAEFSIEGVAQKCAANIRALRDGIA